MDKCVKDVNGCKKEPLSVIVAEKLEDHVTGEDNSESNSLLPPRRGGLLNKSKKKSKRRVQWNDNKGNKLAEVLMYEPSDDSDSSSDEYSDSCICTIM